MLTWQKKRQWRWRVGRWKVKHPCSRSTQTQRPGNEGIDGCGWGKSRTGFKRNTGRTNLRNRMEGEYDSRQKSTSSNDGPKTIEDLNDQAEIQKSDKQWRY